MLAARFGVTVSGQMRVGPNTMATLWTCIRFSLLWSTTLENIKKETHSAIQKQQHIDVNVFPWNRQQKWYSSVNFPENFTWKFKHCFNVIFTCIFLARNTMWNLCENVYVKFKMWQVCLHRPHCSPKKKKKQWLSNI